MLITREQINELKTVIDHMNAFDDENKRTEYLKDHVEDVNLFLSALKNVTKKNLKCEKKERKTEQQKNVYEDQEVISIFEAAELEDIIKQYSLRELICMYDAVFHSKPLSSYNKTKIAQTIKNYVYAMDRAETLLHF